MIELLEANWPLIAIALIIGLLVAWWVFVAMRRTRVDTDRSDVLDEGRGPAARNDALINAPRGTAPAVPPAPVTPQIIEPAHSQRVVAEPVSVAPVEVAASAPSGPSVTPSAVAQTGGDDLTRIKGVGPKLSTILGSLGVHSFAQIAAWSDSDIDEVDAKLGRFQGRIRRDDWVRQAAMLEAGDMTAYESQFGKV